MLLAMALLMVLVLLQFGLQRRSSGVAATLFLCRTFSTFPAHRDDGRDIGTSLPEVLSVAASLHGQLDLARRRGARF